MKIAIPHDKGRLHEHFGGCREFAIVETDPKLNVTLSTNVVPAPEHKPGLFPRWLREQGVDVIIAGGIGQRALANFAHHGITVRAGWANAPVPVLVAAYLDGQLVDAPSGCSQHEHHHNDHDHGHLHHHDHDHHSESHPQ